MPVIVVIRLRLKDPALLDEFFADAVGARPWRNARIRFGLSSGARDLGTAVSQRRGPCHLTTAPAVSGCLKPAREPDSKPRPGTGSKNYRHSILIPGALLFPAAFFHLYYQEMPGSPMSRTCLGWGMDENPSALGVQVAVGPDGDAEEIADATLQLRRELLDLDLDAVQAPAPGEPPPGSRGVDVGALGTLLVNLADSELLASVVGAVRSWLGGSSRRSVKLELDGDVLELTGVSSEEQRRLTDEWLARHASR